MIPFRMAGSTQFLDTTVRRVAYPPLCSAVQIYISAAICPHCVGFLIGLVQSARRNDNLAASQPREEIEGITKPDSMTPHQQMTKL